MCQSVFYDTCFNFDYSCYWSTFDLCYVELYCTATAVFHILSGSRSNFSDDGSVFSGYVSFIWRLAESFELCNANFLSGKNRASAVCFAVEVKSPILFL